MTECEEVAATLDPCQIRTRADAEREVTRQMGPPSEVGYVIHANVAEALYQRATAEDIHTLDYVARRFTWLCQELKAGNAFSNATLDGWIDQARVARRRANEETKS